MATSPNQTSEELTTSSPYVPTQAEVEHRLAQLRSRLPQPNPDPPPSPEQAEPPRAASPQPPVHQELDKAALHGPAGRIVNSLAPHTEAHPAALLLQFLAAFGNLIGPGPHCMVESTRHALNLFVILVGDSSKSRKGTSWNLIANLFAGVDPSWLSTRVNSARLTANGLVRALRDQQPPTDRSRPPTPAPSPSQRSSPPSSTPSNAATATFRPCSAAPGIVATSPPSTCTTNCAPPALTSASSRISPSG